MDKETLTKKAKTDPIIQHFLMELSPIRPFLKEIILFGSRARGQEIPSSDYDILLVVDEKKHKQQVKNIAHEAAANIEITKKVDISLKIFPYDHYEKLSEYGTPFIRNVQKEGIRLNDL